MCSGGGWHSVSSFSSDTWRRECSMLLYIVDIGVTSSEMCRALRLQWYVAVLLAVLTESLVVGECGMDALSS